MKQRQIQLRAVTHFALFLSCFSLSSFSFAQESFRNHFIGSLISEVPLSDPSISGAFSLTTTDFEKTTPKTQWAFSFSHVGRGLDSGRPFQMLPVLGAAYKTGTRSLVALAYDFQSLSFEFSQAKWSLGNARQMGWSLSLVPELKSFSWKIGPWFSMPVGRSKMIALAQIASLNTLGYGLWAEELKSFSQGRIYLFPAQVKFEFDIEKQFQVSTGVEGVWSFSKNVLRSHFALIVGLTKEFP